MGPTDWAHHVLRPLRPLFVVAAAIGALAMAPIAQADVIAQSPPSISGTAQAGQTLTASTGSWTGVMPLQYTYQWESCDPSGANCQIIQGQNASTYVLGAGDVGTTLMVAVTATDSTGATANQASQPTTVVLPAPPANATPPTVAGVAQDGQTLTASPGSWTGATPMQYAYQWQSCDPTGANCQNVPGATNATYAVGVTDVGNTLQVVVSATDPNGSTGSQASQPTSVVAAAPPQTIYVSSTSGSDSNDGSQGAPLQTIGAAMAMCHGGGDTVAVSPGIYAEAVTIPAECSNMTLTGSGPTRPIIDGGNTLLFGVTFANGVHNVTVNGFEIRNFRASGAGHGLMKAAGIFADATWGDTIENNDIHDITGAKPAMSYGMWIGDQIVPGLAHDVTIVGNRVHNIGPGGESDGILLLFSTRMTVEGNEVYLVRKEGIRDWRGLNNTFASNVLYLNWIGINLESGVGAMVVNNTSYDSVWGYSAKHVNGVTAVLAAWAPSAPQWDYFWHNTSYGNAHADIALGMNPPVEDYVDIRDNIFADPGDVNLHDFPKARGNNIIVDGNAYSGSAFRYAAAWPAPWKGIADLPTLTSTLGWETNGQAFAPQFTNPSIGDFSFDPAGLQPGIVLGDQYGNQVGARNPNIASNSWIQYPATVIASTLEYPDSLNLNHRMQYAADGTDQRFWQSAPLTGWQIYDLGSAQTMNTFIIDVYRHMDPRNPKTLTIDVSNDGTNFTTVVNATNPDAEGSADWYQLASPVTARYVRLNITSTFKGLHAILADFRIGLLSPISTGSQPHAVPRRKGLTEIAAALRRLAGVPVTVGVLTRGRVRNLSERELRELGSRVRTRRLSAERRAGAWSAAGRAPSVVSRSGGG